MILKKKMLFNLKGKLNFKPQGLKKKMRMAAGTKAAKYVEFILA